jgi:ribosome-associated protein
LKKTGPAGDKLKKVIIDAALDKKAHDLVELDLRKVEEAVADHFIVCHGDSSTQVNAIANNVIDEVKIQTGEMPYSKEGMRNGEWVLIDFGYIVVHIFYREKRDHYQLEELWSDAKLIEYRDDVKKTTLKSKTSNVRSGKS